MSVAYSDQSQKQLPTDVELAENNFRLNIFPSIYRNSRNTTADKQ